MDDAVLAIRVREKTVTLDYLPDFSTLMREIADLLPSPTPAFVLIAGDVEQEVVVDSDEALNQAFENSTGLLQLEVVCEKEESPPNSPGLLRCLFCTEPLPQNCSACRRCCTESWDAFYLQRFGVEAWEHCSEHTAAELSQGASKHADHDDQQVIEKGYESGDEREDAGSIDAQDDADVLDSPRVAVEYAPDLPPVVPTKVTKAPSQLSIPVPGDKESSELDFDSQPDSARDFPQPEDSTLDRMLETKGKDWVPDSNLHDIEEVEVHSDLEGKQNAAEGETGGSDGKPQDYSQWQSGPRAGIMFSSPYMRAGVRPAHPHQPVQVSTDNTDAFPLVKPKQKNKLTAPKQVKSGNLRVCDACFKLVPWYLDSCRYCEALKSVERLQSVEYRGKVKSKFYLFRI